MPRQIDSTQRTLHFSSPPDQMQSAWGRTLGSYAQCSALGRSLRGARPQQRQLVSAFARISASTIYPIFSAQEDCFDFANCPVGNAIASEYEARNLNHIRNSPRKGKKRRLSSLLPRTYNACKFSWIIIFRPGSRTPSTLAEALGVARVVKGVPAGALCASRPHRTKSSLICL